MVRAHAAVDVQFELFCILVLTFVKGATSLDVEGVEVEEELEHRDLGGVLDYEDDDAIDPHPKGDVIAIIPHQPPNGDVVDGPLRPQEGQQCASHQRNARSDPQDPARIA